MAIKRCTIDRYDEMLEILPPTVWYSYGFLVGEASTHRKCKVTGNISPTYAAFFHAHGNYYEGDDMTVEEFKAFKTRDLP
jgi:hypothetical protein